MKNLLLFLMALALGASAARADLVISLDDANQTGNPGDTLVFTGILSNTGQDTVFLNSLDLNLAGTNFTPDFIDPFFNNVPFWLDPNQATSQIELFSVLINDPFTDLPGTYNGSYTLLGGNDFSSLDVLGSADFSITTPATQTTVPEPSSVLMLAVNLGALVILLIVKDWNRKRRVRGSSMPSVP